MLTYQDVWETIETYSKEEGAEESLLESLEDIESEEEAAKMYLALLEKGVEAKEIARRIDMDESDLLYTYENIESESMSEEKKELIKRLYKRIFVEDPEAIDDAIWEMEYDPDSHPQNDW